MNPQTEPLESQLIANVLRELRGTTLSSAWVRDPALLADARKYGAEEAVRCLNVYGALPSVITSMGRR
ncbi:hypothetical protein Q0M94_12000 [Deinococcus radiomollis]|uniref:hypothetical protein n=1 Tax=Deinococcus radiomollis TaxID=468916 RepID=UPI0038919100